MLVIIRSLEKLQLSLRIRLLHLRIRPLHRA